MHLSCPPEVESLRVHPCTCDIDILLQFCVFLLGLLSYNLSTEKAYFLEMKLESKAAACDIVVWFVWILDHFVGSIFLYSVHNDDLSPKLPHVILFHYCKCSKLKVFAVGCSAGGALLNINICVKVVSQACNRGSVYMAWTSHAKTHFVSQTLSSWCLPILCLYLIHKAYQYW